MFGVCAGTRGPGWNIGIGAEKKNKYGTAGEYYRPRCKNISQIYEILLRILLLIHEVVRE